MTSTNKTKVTMDNSEIIRIGEKQMPFGRYRGKKINTLPKNYLKYLYESGIVSVQNWNDVFWYAKETALKNKRK